MATEDIDQNRDRVAEIFQNRTLLVTGGTGFVGKVLIEKTLRVHDVKKIYVLVRMKKGKSVVERFQQVFNDPLFDLVKKTKGKDILNKVCFIRGDVGEADLGLSDEDRQILIEETEFIFHCAATIRFDEPLKTAVLLNVRGTKLMVQLAKECKKLQVFSHLSTSYCHLNERVLYEKAYPPPTDPDNLIRTCELMSDEMIEALVPKLLKNMPNTYAFTKSLGEAIVTEQMENIPAIILRPSIVMPIWREPIPGWTDNFNGPMGLLIAGGKGVLRTMYCRADVYADYVPVDIVANAMLASILDYVLYKGERRFYNITSSAEYKITFDELITHGRQTVYNKVPFNGVFWYPGGTMTQSRLEHNLRFFFYQWLPAVFVDILLVILGYPPVLKRVQRRILKGYDVFEYYTTKQWDFNNDVSMEARKLLTQRERELYKVDGDGIQYEQYFYDTVHAARLYLLNEPDETIPAAKRHMTRMYYADLFFKYLLRIIFMCLLYKYVLLPVISSF
ncbi:putative fatty acyl-CoA reductase CG5065 [Zophobas morio]|uniref:putative fatty acyl-CoA reductase CG5065 n=1 Tax=Zophobas morio TaxID=2755281 RepID=UPI003082F1A5